MSLEIDIGRVRKVLIEGSGWHRVAYDPTTKVSTFNIDAYEFVTTVGESKTQLTKLPVGADRIVSAHGASWWEGAEPHHGRQMFCPLTSVLAVECW